MITNEASSEPWVCVVAMRNAVITQACQGSWWTLPRLSWVLSIIYEMFLCLHKLILPYIFSFLKHFRLEDILPTAYQNSNNLSFFVNNNHFCFTDLYKKVWKTYMWKFLMRYFILLFLLFFIVPSTKCESVKTNSLIFIFSTIMSSPDKSYIELQNQTRLEGILLLLLKVQTLSTCIK